MITTEILKSKYPKSFDIYKKWVIQALQLTTGLSDSVLTESFGDNPSIITATINARSVFDFFDSFQIYICTDVNMTRPKPFRCYLIDKDNEDCLIESSKVFSTRILAEQYIVKEAFEILEKQL